MFRIFRDPRFLRVARPVATILGLCAAAWHGMHALTAWSQSHDARATDPALADFFNRAFQDELAVAVTAFLAGFFAWQLFRPRPVVPHNPPAA